MSSTPADFRIRRMPLNMELSCIAVTMAGLRILPLYKETCLCYDTAALGLVDWESPAKHGTKVDQNGVAHMMIARDYGDYMLSIPKFMAGVIRAADRTKTGPRPKCNHGHCWPDKFTPNGVGMCSTAVAGQIQERVRRMVTPLECMEQNSISLKDPVRYRFFSDRENDGDTTTDDMWIRGHISSADFLTATDRKGTKNVVMHTIHLDKMAMYLQHHLNLPTRRGFSYGPGNNRLANMRFVPPDFETVPAGFFDAIAILVHARARVLSRFPAEIVADHAELVFVHRSRSKAYPRLPGPLEESESETDDTSSKHRDRIRLMKSQKQKFSFEELIKGLKIAADITSLIELYVAVVEIWSEKKLRKVPNVCALKTDRNAPATVPVRPRWVNRSLVTHETVGAEPEPWDTRSESSIDLDEAPNPPSRRTSGDRTAYPGPVEPKRHEPGPTASSERLGKRIYGTGNVVNSDQTKRDKKKGVWSSVFGW